MTPTDTLYPSQWHLPALGDIERVWQEYSGAGINVVVYDRGIAYWHPDLAANYDASRHVTVAGQVLDGAVTWREERPAHGTSVGGLIAAGQNGFGTVGIAWGASITSVNVFDPLSPAYISGGNRSGFRDALHQMAGFDVMYTLLRDGSVGIAAQAEYLHAVQTGRGGLGTIIAQPAANSSADMNGSLPSRFTISVAASTRDGEVERTSAHGASVLVAAPGEGGTVVTTGLPPRTAPDQPSYTDGFGWTSAASGMIAGVVPLMLEANPGLGWRDVFDILAMSARIAGGGLGGAPRPHENDTWIVNGATHWNAGGLHFSRDFGFGIVDVLAAVRLAESYAVMGLDPATSANEATVASPLLSPRSRVPDTGQAQATLVIGQDLRIDQVDLLVWLEGGPRSDIAITMTSPAGTTIRMLDAGVASVLGTGGVLRLGAEVFRGEQAAGAWTVTLEDSVPGNTPVMLAGVQIEAFGRPGIPADDVYVFTDAFAAMLALDPERARLADTDGGTDWVNAAAVTTDSFIHLAPTRPIVIGGATAQIAAGTAIENAIGGDGADRIIGHGLANRLHGMRGADTVSGLDGNDLLDGGAGDDRLFGGAGADTVIGGAGTDRLAGGAGGDLFLFAPGHSAPGAGRDVVVDFQFGTDLLGFLGGPLALLRHARFSGAGDELRYQFTSGNTLLQVDYDGDRRPDLEVLLFGEHALRPGDIIFPGG